MSDRRRPGFSQYMRPALAKNRELTGSGSSRTADRADYGRSLHISSSIADEPELLVRQNQDLRRRLEEEANNYKRRLESYKQAQQHQAALVSRLQAKILQYKQRCSGECHFGYLCHSHSTIKK